MRLVRRFLTVAAILAMVAVLAVGIWPQYAPAALGQAMSPDAIQRALQGARGGNSDETTVPEQTVKPNVQNFGPATPINVEGRSRIEAFYEKRIGDMLDGTTLGQFGYDTLGQPSSVAIAQSGALSDSYVLGQGDEIVVSLRGQENTSYRQTVSRDGTIVLPKLSPILAAGRTLGDFRRDLEAMVSQSFVSTKVYVTIGNIHQLSILVGGEVRSPGTRIVSALASPIDVILLSGGISKSGSLRNVKLIRAGITHTLDLYTVLTEGGGGVLQSLRDGDRIIVPPLGATVAIAGGVKRPAIFELPPGASGITTPALLRLAGGTIGAGAFDLAKSRLDRDGTSVLIPFTKGGVVQSGEILFVYAKHWETRDRVSIGGSVTAPGARPLSITQTTSDLLGGSTGSLLPRAYTLLAIIARHDAASNSTVLIPFSAKNSIARIQPVPLQANDYVYIFSTRQISALTNFVLKKANTSNRPTVIIDNDRRDTSSPNPDSNDTPAGFDAFVNRNGAPAPEQTNNAPDLGARFAATAGQSNVAPQVPASVGPARAVSAADSSEAAALAAAQGLARVAGGVDRREDTAGFSDQDIVDDISHSLGVSSQALISVAADNTVWVLDEVRVPGPYLAAPGTAAGDAVLAAGGATQVADLSSVEITSTNIDQRSGSSQTTRVSYDAGSHGLDGVTIRSLDVIRMRRVYSTRDGGRVTVAGQVRFPGVFDINRDERLSSVLERAGGLTEVSYPFGAIFTRRQAALNEKEGNQRAAHEIENQLAMLAAMPSNATATPSGQSNITFLLSVAQQLRDSPALGRVTVTADPTVLATKPELDVVLEEGDTLFIPKRPSSVAVSGEVLHPGSFQYQSNLTVADYVGLAGGASQSAEDGSTFVVFPDGSAQPAGQNWLSVGSGGRIPPGSTIVVPRNLRPFDWATFLKDATQIIGQLAVTAASLSVLNKN